MRVFSHDTFEGFSRLSLFLLNLEQDVSLDEEAEIRGQKTYVIYRGPGAATCMLCHFMTILCPPRTEAQSKNAPFYLEHCLLVYNMVDNLHNMVYNLNNIDASLSGVSPGLAAKGERMERQIQDHETNLQQLKQQLKEEGVRQEMAAGEAAESRSKLLMEVQARKELAAALSEATASFEIQISESKLKIDDLERELAGAHKQLQELALAKQEGEEMQEALLSSTLDGAKRLDTAICTMHAALAAMCSNEKQELDDTTDADSAQDLGRSQRTRPHSMPGRPAGFPKAPSTATVSDENLLFIRRQFAACDNGAHTLSGLFLTLTASPWDNRSCWIACRTRVRRH